MSGGLVPYCTVENAINILYGDIVSCSVAYKIFVKGGLWPPHDILFFYMYIINMTTDDRNHFRNGGGIMSKPEWKFGYIQPDGTIIWKNWSELTK